MSVWGALWNTTPSGSVPGTVSEIYSGVVNPQGFQAAPVGSLYIRTTDGLLYRKLGGASTVYGWYPVPSANANNSIIVEPRFGNGVIINSVYGPQTLTWSGNPNVVIGSRIALSGAATYWPNDRFYSAGYTSTVLNNKALWRPNGTIDGGFPHTAIGNGLTTADATPWDCSIDIVTTPRTDATATATTIAELRIWFAVLAQNTTIQASGGMGNTDAIYTAFASSIGVGAALYGSAFRFSTAAGDASWMLCTANDNGAVAAQTATAIGAAVAADTQYRLRMRFQVIAGVPTILASINDGTETAITLNVGSGTTPAAKTTIPLVPYVSVENLNAALQRKSLGWARLNFFFGAGCD